MVVGGEEGKDMYSTDHGSRGVVGFGRFVIHGVN